MRFRANGTLDAKGSEIACARDLILDYVELLDAHGVGSSEVREFKERQSNQDEFLRLAGGAERLFEYRSQIIEELAVQQNTNRMHVGTAGKL